MPSPKDGTAGNLVDPTAPDDGHDADVADPGQVEAVKAAEMQAKTGKYGSADVKPFQKKQDDQSSGQDEQPKEEKTSWIEVVLVDDAGDPVPGEPVEIELSDGSVAGGSTDDKGLVRVDGIPPGECKIKFPNLDKDAWEPA